MSYPIFKPRAVAPMSHCATVIELFDGTLISAWMTGSYEPAPDQHIAVARKAPGSREWTDPVSLPQAHGTPEGQPVFVYDDHGVLWLYHVCLTGDSWESSRIHRRRSEDLGHTWAPAEDLEMPLGWMLRSKPHHLGVGRWLLPAYDERTWQSFMLLSDDDGRSWKPSERIMSPQGNIHPCVVTKGDDRLICYLRTGGKGGLIWRTASLDYGLSWRKPVATSLPNPNSGIDVLRLKSGALIVAFNDSDVDRTKLCVALSDDDGLTWPHLRTLENKPGEFSYPTLLERNKEGIQIVYTNNRQNIQSAQFDEEWVREGCPRIVDRRRSTDTDVRFELQQSSFFRV